MGGNWSPNPLPIRPGSYINFESSGATPVEPGDFGRVGMPITAPWGPENDFVEIVTDADRRAAYGPVAGYDDKTIVAPAATNTSWMITEAIRGGSETVKAYRMVGAGAASASCTIDDWLGQPTVNLVAKYDGSRANNFTITIGASNVFVGKNVLSVVENGTSILEEWLYNEDDVAALVADINNATTGSAYVDATLVTALEVSEVVTIDNSGGPLTAGDFEVVIDFGDGQGPFTSASSIAWNASTAVDLQVAVDSCTTQAGYTAGDLVASNLIGGPGLDVAATTHQITALPAGPLANQNILVTLADANIDLAPALGVALVVTVVTQGARSQLDYATVTMAGGLDGAAPTLADYSAVLSAFEADGGFDLFCLDGVSEEDFVGLNAALKVWAHSNNDAGRYVFLVVGGGATELSGADVAGALSRTALYDAVDAGLPSHPEFVANIGVSGLSVTSPGGNVLDLTAAQAAPRFAGMIASAGITGSVTFDEVVDCTVNGPLTPSQIEQLIVAGVVVFSKRGSVTRVEDGVTTFISLTEEKDFTFTQIRACRAIQQIGLDVSEIVERDWIGQKLNTTSVRDALVARLGSYFATLEANGVLVNGTSVQIDTRYDNTKTNVFILVLAQFQFELKRVLLTVRVPTVS